MADGKWINAQYKGVCAECEKTINIGDRVGYIPAQKSVLCKKCAPEFLGYDTKEIGNE